MKGKKKKAKIGPKEVNTMQYQLKKRETANLGKKGREKGVCSSGRRTGGS